MASRSDISVSWQLSPRLITVAAPSTEVTIQDLHDTLRDLEDEPHTLIYPSIISSAGKESLGGGVSVGLTATLQNARLGFEARPEFFSQGTTTVGTTERTLIDSGADFISDGVEVDDVVRNDTQNAWATVLTVDSATQLTLSPLTPSNNWGSGEDYTIWHVIQCNVTGGNLVAVDSDDNEIDPIYPTGFTQVVRTSSSSATLQELEDIQYASFDGAVHLDAASSYSGTTFPTGTPRQPVNNVADARAIGLARGIDIIHVIGDYTFESGDDISLFEVVGQSRSSSTLTFNVGSIVAGAEFSSCTVQGTMASPSSFDNVLVKDVAGATIGSTGIITARECEFGGTVTLSASLQGEIHLINCTSAIPDSTTPIFDINGADVNILVRNFAGGMEVRNFSNVANNNLSIDMNSGSVILDSTCTTGTITVRGVSLLTDNSNGSTVLTSGLVFPNAIQQDSFNQYVFLDTSSGIAGTKYPIGTATQPVNNLADAKTILANRGLYSILLRGTLVVGPTDSIDDITFKGTTPSSSVVVLVSGCTTSNTQFSDMTVTGVVNGAIIIERCGVQALTNVGSETLGTAIGNSAILANVSPAIQFRNDLVSPQSVLILDCSSLNESGDGPVIDLNGSAMPIVIKSWDGYFELQNYTGGQSSTATINTGTITIDNSCTSGTLRLSGTGTVQDNSNGLTVIDELLDHDDVLAGVAADLIVGSGSTTTEVRTDATQADNFYDNMMLVVVNSAGTIARTIDSYSNTNGAFTLVNALPFTPSSGDRAVVIANSELISQIFVNSILIPAAL